MRRGQPLQMILANGTNVIIQMHRLELAQGGGGQSRKGRKRRGPVATSGAERPAKERRARGPEVVAAQRQRQTEKWSAARRARQHSSRTGAI